MNQKQDDNLQPMSSFWFPKELLNWSPNQDKDAEYNKGRIPLRDRFIGEKVNNHTMKEPNLVALSCMHPTTSGAPSQGGNKFDIYAFNYWQYIDLLVMWGGSANEGLIITPSADVIDAAHKNGVPVLGTVFFPPTEYGGKLKWLKEFLVQNKEGSFPMVDKLIEAAEYYGFDGWFFNQETQGGSQEDAEKMQGFLLQLQENKTDNLHIMWYDAMRHDGEVKWQNALNANNEKFFQNGNKKVSDSMFLNFWWYDNELFTSKDRANELKRDPYQLYAGIDVEANGYNTEKLIWDNLFPKKGIANTSLGIYRPDWTFNSSESQEEFYQKANHFWVGENQDPRNNETDSTWKGIANYFVEKSPITKLPFITHFNTGSGKIFAVNGEVRREKEWNNRSLQDILPTWRWIVDSKGRALKPTIDWEKAYCGGSSLKLSGDLSPKNKTQIKLYKTDLKVEEETSLSIIFNSSSNQDLIKIGLSFKEESNDLIFYSLEKVEDLASEWKKGSISLEEHEGKVISAISLLIESTKEIKDYSVYIGELAVANKVENVNIPSITGLHIDEINYRDQCKAELRLKWDYNDQIVNYYLIYRCKSNGEKELLGATPNNVYYISPLERMKEKEVVLEVVAVDPLYQHGEGSNITFSWSE